MNKSDTIARRRQQAKQRLFLMCFRKSGIMSHSAKQAGISRQLVYYWRDNSPQFEKQMRDAENEALKNIPVTACQGIQRKTRKGFKQDQSITATTTRYIERNRP